MVFEGNTGGTRGDYKCKQRGPRLPARRPATPRRLTEVNSTGAWYQTANVGLAVADNKDLTKWSFLPPILSANCVNDQTERPQIFIQNENGKNKYYLFTISHQFTYADGMRGPDGVYGFVGDGVRSDYQPVNNSGLALGSPTDLNMPANARRKVRTHARTAASSRPTRTTCSPAAWCSRSSTTSTASAAAPCPHREDQLQERRDPGGPQLRPERPRPVRLPAHQRANWRRRPLQVTRPRHLPLPPPDPGGTAQAGMSLGASPPGPFNCPAQLLSCPAPHPRDSTAPVAERFQHITAGWG